MFRRPVKITIDRPLGMTSSLGLNLAWPSYWFAGSGGFFKDGYSDWAQDGNFNQFDGQPDSAKNDIKAQLDLIVNNGIHYVRVWLNMGYYFNADSATVGYTSFQNNMLTSLGLFYDYCSERGIKIMLVLDGGGDFPFAWVNNSTKWATYLNAAQDVINTIKNKSAAWAIDYGNENYAADLGSFGYGKQELTDAYVLLYQRIKSLAPALYCSVGSCGNPDVTTYGVSRAVDFYQLHFYSAHEYSYPFPNVGYDKPMIMGEVGLAADGSNTPNAYEPDLIHRIIQRYIALGYPMVMLWHFYQLVPQKYSPTVYGVHKALRKFRQYTET